jgi:Acyl-protein synthetase, LuxE
VGAPFGRPLNERPQQRPHYEPPQVGVTLSPFRGYSDEARALDAEILACIGQRAVADFNDLSLRIFAHQLRYNEPYANYCASRGITLDTMPEDWEAIPPVPALAFKEAALCTFDPSRAALAFETSGTTQGVAGTHYMETAALYDAALLAGFQHALLRDVHHPLRYLLLVPNRAQRPQSSLGYMMHKVAGVYGDGRHAWYLDGEFLDVDRFITDVHAAQQDGVAICIAGTAFAFVNLFEELKNRRITSLRAPTGSRIMETGGFKGRTRVVERAELYAELSSIFCLPEHRIVAEYGMTELTSQYYDDVMLSPLQPTAPRIKTGPPWMRPRVVGPDGKTLPAGTVGALAHVDLANRSSCVAVQTEDLGVATSDGGIVLIGRERGAELRGCSLDAEQLRDLTRA